MWAETGAESAGRETNAGVSDILVRDVILDGAPSGLRIKSDASRGGPVTPVRYEGVCLRGNRRPIDLDTHYDAGASGTAIPVYRDITLHDVTGTDGTLMLRGHDASNPIRAQFDGLHFVSRARWQIESAEVSAGPGGVPRPRPSSTLLPQLAR
ncbi:glycosyl hydrolase family 28 protein [Sphingomonas sp. SORGH_AS_0879]|uniref:glycosyl hydrolase family 28 protein n=1 Tax=Sphingomonas sp. SORGH_AS_0879 TaxID=3041790 RepID=UPI00277D9C9E|nr:glycosyl hydrolase family 28 protein [Sphingomonas sp. SORGH_AS_0879]MDQ1231217.1 hypothetical protein [Sphingomonas sp. SORGH_AS_0879]